MFLSYVVNDAYFGDLDSPSIGVVDNDTQSKPPESQIIQWLSHAPGMHAISDVACE